MGKIFPVVAAVAILLSLDTESYGQAKSKPDDAAVVKALIDKLKSDDASVRIQAVKALKELGDKAKTAKGVLVKLAESDPDADVRLLAKDGVTAIDEASSSAEIEALRDQLQSTDASVRLGAIKKVKALRLPAKRAIPLLVKPAGSDPDDDVRELAKETLKAATTAIVAEQSVQAILEKLRNDEASVRIEAIKALKLAGDKSPAAKAALAKAAESDPDADVRRLAKEGLKEISSPDVPSTDMKALLEKLQSHDPGVRLGAVKALKTLAPDLKTAVPALLKAADYDPDDDVRALAKECLKTAAPANLVEELAKTNGRIASVKEQMVGLRTNLMIFNQVKTSAQRKIDAALSGPAPDLAVVAINQNAIAVNTWQIVMAQQDLVRFEEEAPVLEKTRERLEEAIKQSLKK